MIFGGPSPEHDVSVLTGLQAARALADAGQQVEAIYWSKTGEFHGVDPTLEGTDFVDGVPRKSRPLRLVAGGEDAGFLPEGGGLGRKRPLELSAVVNCCHGGPGEDGTLQAVLDLAGIRYTGPTVAGAALGIDKLAFAAAVQAAGLPHLPCAPLLADTPPPFAGPYIVKPRFGGSSIGVQAVADHATAAALLQSSPHLRGGAVVEPFNEGADDINVSIRTHPQVELSKIERPLRSSEGAQILDYADKYVGGEGMVSAPRELNPTLPAGQEDTIRSAATAIASLAQVRGVARLDFLAADDEIWVNEINTVPGSLSKYLWEPEVPFGRLLTDMLAEATRGPARAWSVAGADGRVLRSAGSIASKLG